MNAFQEQYQRTNRNVYSIPCADHVLNLVCQAILAKLNATADESEIQEVTAQTHEANTKEEELELRDSIISYS